MHVAVPAPLAPHCGALPPPPDTKHVGVPPEHCGTPVAQVMPHASWAAGLKGAKVPVLMLVGERVHVAIGSVHCG